MGGRPRRWKLAAHRTGGGHVAAPVSRQAGRLRWLYAEFHDFEGTAVGISQNRPSLFGAVDVRSTAVGTGREIPDALPVYVWRRGVRRSARDELWGGGHESGNRLRALARFDGLRPAVRR